MNTLRVLASPKIWGPVFGLGALLARRKRPKARKLPWEPQAAG